MCQLDEMFEPSEKLKKMINVLKFIFTIHMIVLMINLLKFNNNIFMEVITSIILLMSFYSVNFICCGMFIFFSIYNVVFLFISIGTHFQIVYTNSQVMISNDNYISLGLDTFCFCFQLYSVYATFPIYKEMKAQYMENMGMANGEGEEGGNPNEYEGVGNPQQEGGFQAFAGRGVAVGGN